MKPNTVKAASSKKERVSRKQSPKSLPEARSKGSAMARVPNSRKWGGLATREALQGADVSSAMAMLPLTDDPVKKAVITRYLRAMADVLNTATASSLQHALTASTDAGSAAQLLSMGVGLNEAVKALDPTVPAIMRGIEMKRDLLERAGGVLNTARVAELLGISPQAVVKRARNGSLLALEDASGHLQFPALQFTDAGAIPGLKEVLAAFNVESPWTRLAVLLDTDEAVGGKRVIDALRAGERVAVLDVVRSFGA